MKLQERRECHTRHPNDLHSTATFFIEQPIGDNELVATGKNDLDLIEPERATSSYDGHRLSETGMMRIVNR
jgi:hypothetical protein